MSVILLTVLKVTIVVVIALVASRLAGRTRAALRHAVLAVAFAGILVLPVAMRLLPDVRVPLPIVVVPAGVETILPSLVVDEPAFVPGTPAPDRTQPSLARSVPAETIVLALSALGTFIALLPLAASALALRAIRRQGVPFIEGEALLAELANGLGIRRAVAVVLHPDISGPMTCGVTRPLVVFPADARQWVEADLRRAMRHELEHVRRADCLIDGIARLTCAIYWFHPLVWTSWRRLRLEAERACDDAVVGGDDAIAYADQLVALAARVSARHAPVLAMAGQCDLSRRVKAVLDGAQLRGRAGRTQITGLVVGGIALVIGIAPVAASWQAASTTALSFEVASVRENTSGDPFGGGDRQLTWLYPGGRYTARNTTLRELILLAYRWEITRSQLAGLAPWMSERRFDIEARAAEGAVAPGALDVPRAQVMDRMLQTLLADRFKLRVRRERMTGELHVIAVAPGGPKMMPARDAPCLQTKNPGGLTVQADPDPGKACHMFKRIGRTGFEGVAVDTMDITMALRQYLGKPVEDRARLTSLYNVSVRWKPEAPLRADRALQNLEPQADENDPDIYTALREQLGLRLTIERAPIEMLVVESAELPTEN
jgi:uncharacterized protein (TIGR03435 family)